MTVHFDYSDMPILIFFFIFLNLLNIYNFLIKQKTKQIKIINQEKKEN
jgi:hypothetical protein